MKTKPMTFNLTYEQYEILKTLSKTTGETINAYVDRVVFGALFDSYNQFALGICKGKGN